MRYGYAGTILRADLSNEVVRREPLPDVLVENFIGGRGFVAKMLYDEIVPGIEPFDPQNLLIAATGPLTGHFLPASGKTHFGTKSPATGGYADSNMGGHFGPQLKYAGYDVLVITGKAERPSFLFIHDDTVEIRPAAEYWGQGSITAERNFKDHLGADYQVITIGPAGENRVRYACISHDFGRQAGRTGVGAVMGSKNLKAVVVKGKGRIPLADPDRFKTFNKQILDTFQEGVKVTPLGLTVNGTAGVVMVTQNFGVLPTKNWQQGTFDGWEKIHGEELTRRFLKKNVA